MDLEERTPHAHAAWRHVFAAAYVPDENIVVKAESSPHRPSTASSYLTWGQSRPISLSTNSIGDVLLEKQQRKEVEVDDDCLVDGRSEAGEESDFGFSPLFGPSLSSWNK